MTLRFVFRIHLLALNLVFSPLIFADSDRLPLLGQREAVASFPWLLEAGMVLLVVLILGLAAWTTWLRIRAWYSSRDKTRVYAKVEDIFLNCQYQQGTSSGVEKGYLRSLGMDEASFVSQKQLGRSQVVNLELPPFPGVPNSACHVQGRVVFARPVKGDPNNYLVGMRFPKASPSHLQDYILRLRGDVPGEMSSSHEIQS